MMGINAEIKSVSASTSTFNITSNCSNSALLPCALMTVLVVASKASLATAAESDGAAQAANEIIANTAAPNSQPQEPISGVKNAILESATPTNCSQNQTKPAVLVLSNSTEDYLDCFCPLKIFKGISGGLPSKITTNELEPLLGHGLTFQHVTVEDILANMKKNEISALGRAVTRKMRTKKEKKGRGASQKNSQKQNVKKGGDNKKSSPTNAKFLDDRNDSVEPPSYEEDSKGDLKVQNSKAKKRDKGNLRLSNDADGKDTSDEKSSNGKPKKRDKNLLRGEKSEEAAGKPKKRDKNLLRGEKSEEAAGKPKKRDKNFLRGEKSEEAADGKPKKRDKSFLRAEKSEEVEGKAKKKDVKLLRAAKKKSKPRDNSKSTEKDTKKKAKKRINTYALRVDLTDDVNESDLIERSARLSAKRRNKVYVRTRTLATDDDDQDEVPKYENEHKSKQRNKNYLRMATGKAENSEEDSDLPEKQKGNSRKRDQKLLRNAKVSIENSEEDLHLSEKQKGNSRKRDQKLLRNAKVSIENSGEELDLPEKKTGKPKNREQKMLRNAKAFSADPERPKDDEPSAEKSTGKAKKRNKQTLRGNSAEESKDGRAEKPPEEGSKAMRIAKNLNDDYDARPQGRARKRNKFLIRISSNKDIEDDVEEDELQGQSREQNQNNVQVKIRESDEDLIGDPERITSTVKIRNKKLLRNAKVAQEYDYDENSKGTAKKRNKSFRRDGKSTENEPDLVQGRRAKTKGTKVRSSWSRAMGTDDSTSLEDLFNMNKWQFKDASEPDYSEEIRGKTGAKKLNPSSLKIAKLKQQRTQAKKLSRKSKAWVDYLQNYEDAESEDEAGRRGGLRRLRKKLIKRPKFRIATTDHDEDGQETESEDDTGRSKGLRPTKRRKLNKRRKFRIATSDEDESEDAAGRFSWGSIVKVLNPNKRKKSRGLPTSAEYATSSAENDGERKPKTEDQSMLRRAKGDAKNKDIRESDSANDSDSDEESISNESENKKEKQKQAKKKSKKKLKKHKKGKRRGRSPFSKFSALEHQNLCICLPRLSNAARPLGETHYGKIAEEPSDNTSVTLEVARKEQPDLKIHFRPI